MKKRGLLSLVLAALAVMALLVGTIAPASAAPGPAVQRPISDFLNAQGTTSVFTPPVPDQIGWATPFTQINGRFALFDYTGKSAAYLATHGISLGTTTRGSVTERPLADGRAEVTVVLKTDNALAWAVPYNPNDPPSQFNTNPLLFGYRAQDLIANPNLKPALGNSEFQAVFINTAPGAPLPDLVKLINIPGGALPGQEIISLYFHGQATGPLHASAGLGPEGTPGRLIVSQTAPWNRTKLRGATADGFPVENIELRAVGR